MRGLTTTIAGAVVLAGLAGYIYFVDADRPVGDAPMARVFADTSADDVEEIRIALAGADATLARKVDGRWRLTEPVATEADEGELSSIASSLSTLEVQQEVSATVTDFARYGLEPPRIAIEARAKGQTEPRRIHLGDKAPATGDLYARLPGASRVFLVPSYVESTFNKDTFALRDKTILRVDREKADSLAVTGGGRSLRFAKKGEEWMMVAPVAARAEYAAVEGALERLASARMQGIAEAEAADLKKYGLDRPSAVMTIGAGSATAELALGATENAVIFARDASRPMVFTVAPTLRDDVLKDAGEYRRKDLFDSRSFTATRVELRRGAETIALTRSKGANDKAVWKNAAGTAIDTAKVDDLLTRLTGLRAQSFQAAAHASLKAPALAVTVTFDPSRTESVTFGRAGADVFAGRPDEPGAAIVEAAAFDETMKALDAVK